MKLQRRAVLALAGWALAARAQTQAVTPAQALKAGVFSPPRAAPDFTLRGSDGAPLSLSRWRGRVVLLVFGYVNCPAVCPTTLATLAQTRQKLGGDAARLQVVYVTVDPERDNAEVMRGYLAAFDSGFIGATGTPEQLARVRADYGVTAVKVPMGGSYGINHSSSVYLVDREGRLRGMMPFGRAADDYVHDVRLLLASR